MATLARVSERGQVVIPAEIRKKLRVSKLVVISEENGMITMKPTLSLEDAFGIDGKVMREVARGITEERRKEAESDRP